jgi:hypothetical protein
VYVISVLVSVGTRVCVVHVCVRGHVVSLQVNVCVVSCSVCLGVCVVNVLGVYTWLACWLVCVVSLVSVCVQGYAG